MAAAGTAQASDAESKMNSVERMIEYDKNAEEAALETSPEVAATLPLGWPRSGSIALEKVELRYRPELPLVLRGISFEAASGDKIGIVGCVMCLRCTVLCAPAALPPYPPSSQPHRQRQVQHVPSNLPHCGGGVGAHCARRGGHKGARPACAAPGPVHDPARYVAASSSFPCRRSRLLISQTPFCLEGASATTWIRLASIGTRACGRRWSGLA